MLFRVFVAIFATVGGRRANMKSREAKVTLHNGTSEESDSGGPGRWGVSAPQPPKLDVVSVAEADAKFRSKDEPLLVPGEVVEMAFYDGYVDWLLFTSLRVLEVDGERTLLSGLGKGATPDKVAYKSKLWKMVCRRQMFVEVETAGGKDNDVEVKLLPGGTEFEFAKKIGDNKLFEIGAYLRGKVEKYGAEAKPANYCSYEQLRRKHDELGLCHKQSEQHLQVSHALKFLHFPDMGTVKPSDVSAEVLLGPGKSMIGKDETILFTFTKSRGAEARSGRYDHYIITDKQIISVDQKFSKTKKEYTSYPFPLAFNSMDPWKYVETWEIETASRTGIDKDLEMKATMPKFGRSFQMEFDKKFVKPRDLFAYHSQLQAKILATTGE